MTGESSRVVVVGVGALTALGPTVDDLWAGCHAGRVAIKPVRGLRMDGFGTDLAGEVDQVPERRRRSGRPRRSDRALDLVLVAADEAMGMVPAGMVADERTGLVLGTCNAGLLSAREWLRSDGAGEEPDPELVTLVTPQGLAEATAAEFRFGGPVLAVSTACASGANAIGLAAELVRLGRADAMLAGGTDALSDVVLAGFAALESLSPKPAAPYSGNRTGLSLGEGAAMVLLVRADLAERARLPVVAEVAGYGLSADGHHPTTPRPDGAGAAEAMRAALRHAGVKPDDVGYVNGHGTGTAYNDPAETKAIRLALGDAADRALVSSTKSTIGHLLGASGAAEAIVTMRAVAEGIAPPTAGYLEPDPECDLDYVVTGAKPFAGTTAMSNNFGFGGANAALVVHRDGMRDGPPLPEPDRIVITGVGVLSPAGDTVDHAWQALADGREVCGLDGGHRLGRVDLDPDPVLSRRERRRMDRLGLLSVVATASALTDAGLRGGCRDAERVGVLFGTGTGPVESMARFVSPLLAEGPRAASPGLFPSTVYNQTAGHITMRLGLRGPTSTLSVGHATGLSVLSYAADLLATGHADTIVAVVADALTEEVVRAYAGLGLLSDRPDGAGPDGRLSLAEGGVALVLERRRAALERGADIRAEILGAGAACDASTGRRWDPRGSGMERAMRAALDSAGTNPDDVDAVWLAASGVGPFDRAERRAVDRVFATPPPVHAPKLLLGEPMGAGGALNLAVALRGLSEMGSGVALVNDSSLGGSHVSVVVAVGKDREG